MNLPSTLHIVDKDGGVGDVDSDPNEGDKEKGDEETEQDKARKKREEEFMGRLNSGALDAPKLEYQRPGKVYTLPVVRPKLL